MKYRKVGKSGLKISEVSLGSWLTYGGSVETQIAKECMNTAVENGINFIDSAEAYAGGKAEEVIGEWLKEETIDRRKMVISSKVFWPTSDDINDWGNSRKNILNAIDGTLKRLDLDYIDIYYLHRYDYLTPIKETVEVMDNLVKSGKILYWGTSTWTAAQLERVNAVAKEYHHTPPIVEQPRYNMFSRHIEVEILEIGKTHGMGFTVWSPLAQGLLTGKYNDEIPEGSRAAASDTLKGEITPDNIEKVKKLGEVANGLDITTSQLALAWILRRSQISAAIIGATKPKHVVESAGASGIILSNDVLHQIEEILDNRPEWPPTYAPNIYYEDRMR